MTGLPTITLHQPWASLVALGVKTIETRSRPTKVRGRIAIHAAAKEPRWIGGSQYAEHEDLPWVWVDGGEYRWVGPLGAIVATAELVDCVPICVESAAPDGPYLDVPGRPDSYPIDVPPHAILIRDARLAWEDVTDQLPFGDFTPGRSAWLLADVKPTTERCPACWGNGWRLHTPDAYLTCETCGGRGQWTGTGRCEPIPAKGRQGWWRWEP